MSDDESNRSVSDDERRLLSRPLCAMDPGDQDTALSMPSGALELGDSVFVRDGPGDEWKPGVVKALGTGAGGLQGLQVQPKGWQRAYVFAEVREASVEPGVVCGVHGTCPKYESTASVKPVGKVKRGETVTIAAGPFENVAGLLLVPIEPTGAVELSQLYIKVIEDIADLDKTTCKSFWNPHRIAAAVAVTWFILGFIMYMSRAWGPHSHRYTVAEVLYVQAQIITTVGYGDYTPSSPWGQMLITFYVLMAVMVISTVVSALVDSIMSKNQEMLDDAISGIADSTQFLKDNLGQLSPDLAKDALASITPKAPHFSPALVDLAKALLIWGAFLLFGTIFYSNYCENETCGWEDCCTLEPDSDLARAPEHTQQCCEGKTVIEALYMSVITLTTVGFGDKTPSTATGRGVSVPWMVLGVAAFGNLVGKFSAWVVYDDKKTRKGLSSDWLRSMFKDPIIQEGQKQRRLQGRSRPQVNRAEFILFMLKDSGLLDPSLVDKFSGDFSDLDQDGSGYLNQEDLAPSALKA